MIERNTIFKIVKAIESEFEDVIAYAHFDGNGPMTCTWWTICISNWELYYSKEFKEFSKQWHERAEKRGLKLLFCYCNPLEENLLELAEKDNLIMNL